MKNEEIDDIKDYMMKQSGDLRKNLTIGIPYMEAAEALNFRGWANKLPYIKFPAHWLVKAISPFLGAMVRYNITVEGFDGIKVDYME